MSEYANYNRLTTLHLENVNFPKTGPPGCSQMGLFGSFSHPPLGWGGGALGGLVGPRSDPKVWASYQCLVWRDFQNSSSPSSYVNHQINDSIWVKFKHVSMWMKGQFIVIYAIMVFNVTCVTMSLTLFEACAKINLWSTTSPLVSPHDTWHEYVHCCYEVYTRVTPWSTSSLKCNQSSN